MVILMGLKGSAALLNTLNFVLQAGNRAMMYT